MGLVKTEEGGAEEEGGAREEAVMEVEANNSEAEESDPEGAKLQDEVTSDLDAEKLNTGNLADNIKKGRFYDRIVEEEAVIDVVKMKAEEGPIEKKAAPLSEAELGRAEAELRRSLFTGQRFCGVSLPLRAETRTHRLLAPVYQLAAAGKSLLPVQHCLAAMSSDLFHRPSLFFLLAGCLQIDCKATRKAVIAALPDLLKGPREVFEFWEIHKEVFKRVAKTDFGGREFGKEKIFIGGVPGDVEEEELFRLFSRFGRVTSVEHVATKRCAFVTFIDGRDCVEYLLSLPKDALLLRGWPLVFGRAARGGPHNGRVGEEKVIHRRPDKETKRKTRGPLGDIYRKMDVMKLARASMINKRRHAVNHSKVIIKTGVYYSSPEDPARAALLTTLVKRHGDRYREKGLEQALAKTTKLYEDKPEAVEVLGYMKAVLQIKTETEPDVAAQLILQNSFDVDVVNNELLEHGQVWEALLASLPLERILENGAASGQRRTRVLQKLARKGFLDSSESPVLQKLLLRLASEAGLRESGLQPAELLCLQNRVVRRWEPIPSSFPAAPDQCRDGRPRLTEGGELLSLPSPHRSLAVALGSLLDPAMAQVARAQGRVLVMLDTRPTISTNCCWGTPGLPCSKAMALTILSLMAGGANVKVFTPVSERVEMIALEEGETVAGLEERLARVQGGQVVDPTQVFSWLMDGGTVPDMVMVLTDCHTVLRNKEDFYSKLDEYRGQVPGGGDCKVVYSVLATRDLLQHGPVARLHDPGMMDICGWDPDYVRIVQAFLTHRF